MKKLLLLITIIFTMNIIVNAQTKLDGAGVYKFGLSKSECISILDKNNISHHTSTLTPINLFIDEIKFGTIIFDNSVFEFSNEGLYGVSLIQNKTSNSDEIFDILVKKYGTPTRKIDNSSDLTILYVWKFDDNNKLFYSEDVNDDKIFIIYTNTTMEKAWKEYSTKKNSESF